MLCKTQGIVLNYVKYRETSVIARIYTEEFGYQSFIINGIRSKKSKKGLALLQPLTLLDLVIYYKRSKEDGIHRISEYKCLEHFSSIPFDIKKATIALFITELLARILREEEHHGGAYSYLYGFIMALDQRENGYENMHIQLMISLAHYLGFGIHELRGMKIQDFHFQNESEGSLVFDAIIGLQNENDISISNELRREVLDFMVNYYVRHVDGFEGLKSIDILNQIFG